MILYHGSTEIIEHPRIIKSENGRDFGFGFYTTDIIEQAERWANRKAMLAKRKGNQDAKPVLNVYEWNERTDICSVKKFPLPNIEWLDMVIRCRSDINYTHGFDIVEGCIANDNVGETVQYVLNGIMRKEDAVERLKFEKINRQITFCTKKALAQISFVSSDVLEV